MSKIKGPKSQGESTLHPKEISALTAGESRRITKVWASPVERGVFSLPGLQLESLANSTNQEGGEQKALLCW